ncbi:MAG: hypothetical protein J6B71_08885 [Clostridia bacterium]|nr:hypothetical protein [Clostridia bacterium]
MNLWEQHKKTKNDAKNQNLMLHFDPDIEPELKTLYLSFSRWLRKEYFFPKKIHIYIRNCENIRLKNGKPAYGSFRYYQKRTSMIQIPSKVEEHLLGEYTKEDLYEQILSSFVHELTHYYQWIDNLEQDNAVSERQANYFRYRIIEQYYLNR